MSSEVLDSFVIKCHHDFGTPVVKITRGNVNTLISEHTEWTPPWTKRWINLALMCNDKEFVEELIMLGAVVSADTLEVCPSSLFHWLLHSYVNPNTAHHHLDWARYAPEKITLLAEYNNAILFNTNPFPLVFREHIGNAQKNMLVRENNCRKAILTIIWIAKQMDRSLKDLFVVWAKWIWNMKPYTDALEPFVGRRSPIWDLKVSQDLSKKTRAARKRMKKK